MIEVREAYEAFIKSGIDMFTGVPDSLLKNICAFITDTAPREKHIIAANEGNAIGIAAGHYLATSLGVYAEFWTWQYGQSLAVAGR